MTAIGCVRDNLIDVSERQAFVFAEGSSLKKTVPGGPDGVGDQEIWQTMRDNRANYAK
jgi:hypothetical protein